MRRLSCPVSPLGLALCALLAGAAAATGAGSPPLPLLSPGAPVPAAAAVAAALAPTVFAPALGGGLAGEVIDAQSGAVLWSRNAGQPMQVASTQKLTTAAAALTVLGPAFVASTELLSTGVRRGAELDGDLDLRGGGDVLLSNNPATGWPARSSLAALAAALAGSGIRRVTGGLVADGALFGGDREAPGWRSSYVTEGSVAPVTALEVNNTVTNTALERRGDLSADPALQAAADLRVALARYGVIVAGPTVAGSTPPGAITLARVNGPPVEVDIAEMLENSDNDMAEALGRLVAIRMGAPATFAGAAAAITAAMANLGLPTQGVALVDASGLSPQDQVPPALLAGVLHLAAADASSGGRIALRPILPALSTAAFDGTLIMRDRTGPEQQAAGLVRAKTGNIDGVTSIAGSLVDADGRELLFVLVTDSSGALIAAETAFDQATAALLRL